jgi:hypothetical protein
MALHGVFGFAGQRGQDPFEQRASDPHSGTVLFLVRVFAPHSSLYQRAGGTLPAKLATERVFWDGFFVTSLPYHGGKRSEKGLGRQLPRV